MPLYTLADMTWEEVRGLDRSRTVALLPIGAIEAHGPHLPLATDVVIAEAMARAGATRLAARGLVALLLPPLAYSVARFAAAFDGTFSLRPATAAALLLDVGRGLAAQGFTRLAIANAHLDPAHLAALTEAVATLRAEGRPAIAFPDLTRKPWAPRLTEEFRSGACHAGRFESSLLLAARPDLVREELRRALPPNPASLSRAIRDGKADFAEAGGPRAYFGWPADASAEEGRRTLDVLGDILEEAVLDLAAVAVGSPAAADAPPERGTVSPA